MEITLDELWAPIRTSLIAQGAKDNQRHEMKKAFFCGAHRALSVLAEKLTDDMPDEEYQQLAQKMQFDIESYVEGGWRSDPEFAPAQPGED